MKPETQQWLEEKGDSIRASKVDALVDPANLEDEPRKELSESIKLTKNSKGYNWEVRLLEVDIDRLEELNNEMLNRFGG